MAQPITERFWSKVDLSGDCWLWTACKGAGYGQFWMDGTMRGAHRIAYEWIVGPIPDGMQIDHLCRTPACVRPEHLEPVTTRENQRRGTWGMATACIHGHEKTPENTYVTPRGHRRCRICQRAAYARYRLRRKELANV